MKTYRGVKFYDGFYQLLNQWNQPWQCLCDHRAWIHHGLWNRENVKLRPLAISSWSEATWSLSRHTVWECRSSCCPPSVIVCTVLGIVIERVAYKPLRDASPLSVLDHGYRRQLLYYRTSLSSYSEPTQSPFTSVVTIPALKFADGAITVTGEDSRDDRFLYRDHGSDFTAFIN